MKLHQIPGLSLIALSLAVSACAQTAERRAVMVDATTGALVGPSTFFTANASAIAAAADGAFADGAITIAKIDGLATALGAKAPLASPTFTAGASFTLGSEDVLALTHTGMAPFEIGQYAGSEWLMGAPGEGIRIAANSGGYIILQTDGALTLEGATVELPTATSIGTVSATEIGYLDGVTSALQTQISAKAPTASPTFTGTVAMSDGSGGSVSLSRGSGSWAFSASTNLGLDLGVAGTGVIGLFGPVTFSQGLTLPGDVEVTDTTKGLILKSADGSRWRVSVNDAGVLSATEL